MAEQFAYLQIQNGVCIGVCADIGGSLMPDYLKQFVMNVINLECDLIRVTDPVARSALYEPWPPSPEES